MSVHDANEQSVEAPHVVNVEAQCGASVEAPHVVNVEAQRGETQRATPSVEDWAARYIASEDLHYKCEPPEAPTRFADVEPRHVNAPGRPKELIAHAGRTRSLTRESMREPRNRAKLLHKFWHHELQAAELMCWALLRFADAELEFRRGLLHICRDELRHMRLYQAHIEGLGFALGDFPVRDWFWERVPTCSSKVAFVALLGMGLEAANLEHTARFATWFDFVGDTAGAELQHQVGREEVAHVRFATRWFRNWTGHDDFEHWSRALPEPLSPLLMRGKTINRDARRKAEMSDAFIDALSEWRPGPAQARTNVAEPSPTPGANPKDYD